MNLATLSHHLAPRSWKTTVIRCLTILMIALCSLTPIGDVAPAQAATMYIYPTFKSDAAADQKLYVYTSSNGTSFSLLSNTGFGGPTGVLRDPSLIRHTDGRYYIAFTV